MSEIQRYLMYEDGVKISFVMWYFTCYMIPIHPYFDIVVGLVRSYDPESYAGGSLLLVGSPMPDRSKVMTQIKRDALALQAGGR